jgi:hypothetical protein
VVFFVILSVFLVAGAWAQEASEAPETPATEEAAEVSEPQETPEEPAEPEAPPGLVFETTVDFAFVKRASLDGQAGEVEIRGVEFTSASGKGGLFSSGDAELDAGIVIKLECATTADKKQKLDLGFQFFDSDGALIDRTKNSVSLKNESKIFETGHKTLKYVVPLIAKVKITVSSTGKN